MYLCMSEIRVGQNIHITHGKALTKYIAERAAAFTDIKHGGHCRIISWVEKADTPHKCDVQECTLNSIYLRNKMWGLGIKLLLYNECKKFLESKLPVDIVLYIMEKCFCRKQLKF